MENWHQNAFSSFGSGHGVWEAGGGSQLPFSSRNLRTITQWAQAITPADLMPTLRRLQPQGGTHFDEAPPVPGTARTLRPKADVLQAYGAALAACGHDPRARGRVRSRPAPTELRSLPQRSG